MKHYFSKLLLFIIVSQAAMFVQTEELPRIRMETSKGTMEIELYADKSPRTVKNFLNYVDSKYYEGFIFHRVISGWLIQSGGYDKELRNYGTEPPIRNEAVKNRLKNLRGTISMARFSDPNSADSQFFINLSDNPSFDFKSRTPSGAGYCVFGKVVSGIEVADAIGEVETHAAGHLEKDVPVIPVLINKVELIN